MSDDEYSRSGGQLDSPSHKKGPRFSWTPAYEATFFRSLCESVTLGLKDNHSFKQEAWDRAKKALQEKHGAYPNKGHLINKSDNARKKFRLWRGLRENPAFLYNPVAKTITGSEEAWRAHIEKEPLSRSLRGRPFEHEEYYEILFPDVIGSGGAPKRVTKPRRKGPDTLPGSEGDQETPGTAILHLLNDGYGSVQNASATPSAPLQQQQPQPQHQQQQQPQPPPPHPAVAPGVGQQRPTQTSIPPRASIPSASALTPPDENAPQMRKRFLPAPENQAVQPVDKRRRTATNNFIDLTHTVQAPPSSSSPLSAAAAAAAAAAATPRPESVALLTEALSKSAPPAPRWPEQAMDIFFRDFAEEDMDLQIKIAEKMLTDTNKAAMFCKMPLALRKHWVKRLREAHNSRAGN